MKYLLIVLRAYIRLISILLVHCFKVAYIVLNFLWELKIYKEDLINLTILHGFIIDNKKGLVLLKLNDLFK